jgi:hypothetical protein
MKRPGDNDPIHVPSLSDSALDDTSHFADIVLTESTATRSAIRSSKDQQGQQKKGYLLTLMSAFIDKNPSPDAPSPKIDNALAAQSGKGDSRLSEETPSLLRRLLLFYSTSSSDQEADSDPSSRNVSPRGIYKRSKAATGVSATPILKKVDVEKFSGADPFTSSTMSIDQARASGDYATDLLKKDVTEIAASDDRKSIGFASMVSSYFSVNYHSPWPMACRDECVLEFRFELGLTGLTRLNFHENDFFSQWRKRQHCHRLDLAHSTCQTPL